MGSFRNDANHPARPHHYLRLNVLNVKALVSALTQENALVEEALSVIVKL